MAFLSTRTQFSLLLTLHSSSWPSRTVLPNFGTQLMVQSWSQNHCFRGFSCSHPALEIQRINILGAGFSMPPGLGARQLSAVRCSIGISKDYLGSFMCCHNWQYPSCTYYSIILLSILPLSTLFKVHVFIKTL